MLDERVPQCKDSKTSTEPVEDNKQAEVEADAYVDDGPHNVIALRAPATT